MAIPNAITDHEPNSGPALRQKLTEAGWTLAEAALLCGVNVRTLERYLTPKARARGHEIPYPLQFTLEALAVQKRPPRSAKARQPSQPKPAADPPAKPNGSRLAPEMKERMLSRLRRSGRFVT